MAFAVACGGRPAFSWSASTRALVAAAGPSSPLARLRLLLHAAARALLLCLGEGHARADATDAAAAPVAAGDKAAAGSMGGIGRPDLADGLFSAARRWVLGDKPYVGMLAGHEGGCD